MAQNEIGIEDTIALIAVPFFAGIALGVFTLKISIFSSFSFSDTLFSSGSLTVTWAQPLTSAGLAWIVGTNEIDGSDYENYEYGIILAAFAVVPVDMLIPSVAMWLDTYPLLALGAWLVVSAMAIFISYVQ